MRPAIPIPLLNFLSSFGRRSVIHHMSCCLAFLTLWNLSMCLSGALIVLDDEWRQFPKTVSFLPFSLHSCLVLPAQGALDIWDVCILEFFSPPLAANLMFWISQTFCLTESASLVSVDVIYESPWSTSCRTDTLLYGHLGQPSSSRLSARVGKPKCLGMTFLRRVRLSNWTSSWPRLLVFEK